MSKKYTHDSFGNKLPKLPAITEEIATISESVEVEAFLTSIRNALERGDKVKYLKDPDRAIIMHEHGHKMIYLNKEHRKL